MRTSGIRGLSLAFAGLAIFLFARPLAGQPVGDEPAEDTPPEDATAGSAPPPETGRADAEAAQLATVTVTGSHIRRAEIEGPLPVQIVTPDMVREVGGVKLGDYLPYLPVNQGETRFADTYVGGPAGHYFNLRGLGAHATLVLINGRRVSSFAAESSVFNVDSIPLAAIERVEILKDGASAIYGADAIAGVVNIILKEDYSGFEVTGSQSNTADGGAAESSVEFVGGTFLGRTNITMAASWYDREPLYYRDRAITASSDQSLRGGYDRRSTYSSPPNAVLLEDYANGILTFVPDPACPEDQLSYQSWLGDELCAYDFASTALLMAGNERWSITLAASHPLTSSVTLRAELGYDDDHVKRELAPAALQGFVPAAHPDNPFGQDAQIYSRIARGGLRTNYDDTVGRRGAVDLEGFSGAWAWRSYVTWSDSRTTSTYHGGVLGDRYQAALVGEGGPNADQWYNPFGLDPDNDPELVQWMIEVPGDWYRTRERSAGVVADAPVFVMPAGELAVAVGAEYRDEAQWKDGADPVNATRQVRSMFIEFAVPLLAGVEAQLAARYENYSDFGSNLSPKIALAWRPNDTLLVRASYAESFRPPDFNYLYAPGFEGETFATEDPQRCPVTGEFVDCYGIFPMVAGGNPDLDPEVADSWNVGLVWSPGAPRGLDVEIDLWKIHYDDIYNVVGVDWVIENYPAWVERSEPTDDDIALGIPGSIERIRTGVINISKARTSGVDFTLRYSRGLDTVGDVMAEVTGTYLDYWKYWRNTSTSEDEGANMAGTNYFGGSWPRWRVVSSLHWLRGPNAASATVRFVDSYREYTNWPDEDGNESDRPHRVGSWTTVDLQYTRTFRSLGDGRLSVGCNNCADRDPPLYLGGPFDRNVHDVYGRRWFVRWSQPFASTVD